MSKSHGTYLIGKGRPPKATQFKPGESGNLAGRPKGSKNASTRAKAALNRKVTVTINGRRCHMTVDEIAFRRLGDKAMAGDQKAHGYPTLKARLFAFAKVHSASKVLIEDAGVGTALFQEMKKIGGISAVAVKPERSKRARMSIESAKFESGQVYFPERAPWLADLEMELFTFPQSRHDDQVDSISQALAHSRSGYDTTQSWVG